MSRSAGTTGRSRSRGPGVVNMLARSASVASAMFITSRRSMSGVGNGTTIITTMPTMAAGIAIVRSDCVARCSDAWFLARAVRGGNPGSDRAGELCQLESTPGNGGFTQRGGFGELVEALGPALGPEAEDEGQQVGDRLVEVDRDELADLAGLVERPGQDGLVDDRDAVLLGLGPDAAASSPAPLASTSGAPGRRRTCRAIAKCVGFTTTTSARSTRADHPVAADRRLPRPASRASSRGCLLVLHLLAQLPGASSSAAS